MNLMGIFDNESQTTSNSATNEEKIGELNKSRPAVEVASISLQFVSTKKHRVHMSTTGIDDLPPEMFCELFEHLQPMDLIACSMVNKRWHSIYAAFKVHRLVSIDHSGLYTDDQIQWYGSKQPIREAERCRPVMFRRLVEKPLLCNLMQLALFGYELMIDLNLLNRFRRLEHLEIDTNLIGQIHLSLPRLRVLAIHGCNFECNLSIDSPLLSTLLYAEDKHLLDVNHPETIRRLETNMVGAKLVLFKGVECLVTKEFEAISQATLLVLPELRELRYDLNIKNCFRIEARDAVGTVDRVKRTLSEFVSEAKKLRGSDFRFLWLPAGQRGRGPNRFRSADR